MKVIRLLCQGRHGGSKMDRLPVNLVCLLGSKQGGFTTTIPGESRTNLPHSF